MCVKYFLRLRNFFILLKISFKPLVIVIVDLQGVSIYKKKNLISYEILIGSNVFLKKKHALN